MKQSDLRKARPQPAALLSPGKLAPSATILTIAGAVQMPDWINPFHPPTEAELRALFGHMNRIGLPASAWNEWRKGFGDDVQRVSDIKSLINLWGVWLYVCRWQISCRVEEMPNCSWGVAILQQVKHSKKNPPKKVLTDEEADLLFASPAIDAA